MSYSGSPDHTLDFLSEKALHALTQTIEDRLIKKIQQNPQKFFPNLTSTDSSRNDQFLSVKEVAKRLKTTPVTVRNLCHDGKLKYSKPAGRSMMITEKDYQTYLQTTQNNSNA